MSKEFGPNFSQKVRSGTRSQATDPLKRDRRDSHIRDIQHRDQPREDKADGPDFRSSASQGKSGVPRHMIHSPTNRDKWGALRRRGIRSSASRGKSGVLGRLMVHSLRNWDKRGSPHRCGIRSSAGQDDRGTQHRRGIHTLGERGNRDHPNSLGIDSSAVGRLDIHSLDIRKQDTDRRDIHTVGSRTHRPGNRNRCPVAAEVSWQLPQIFRLLHRSPLRARLPARRLPLLQ